MQQNGLLTIDSTYQITATVTGNPSLLVFNSSVFYNDLASRTLSNGTNTYILKAKAINFAITNAGGDSCDVTNISVTEITPSDHGGIINGATYVDKQPTIPQLGMMDWAKGSNLCLNSEPTGAEGPESDVTYGSYSWGLNGFSNATIFGDNSVLRYRYGSTILASTEYTISCFVIMDDLSEPNVSLVNVVGDFGVVLAGTASGGVINANQSMGNNIWRVSKTATSGTSNLTNNGVIKYTGQSSTGFKVVGYQLEESSSAGNYILTDGAAAIDVTTIQNPTNKGYDILGNALRLREHAFNLDGSGYAEIADDDSLDFGTGDFSIECWAKFDFENKGSSWNSIVSLGDSIVSTTSAGLATKVGKFYFNIGGTTTVGSTPVLVVGNWYHVVGTRTGTTMRLYINTAVESLTATSAQTVTNTGSKIIGDDAAPDKRAYKNLIDEPRIYNRALTQKEITNNYKVGLTAHS